MRTAMLILVCVVCASSSACNRGFSEEAPLPPEMPPPELPRSAVPPSQPLAPLPTPESAPPRRTVRGTPEANGAGGLAWVLPTGFVAEAPQGGMRAAQYSFPGENGEGEATLAVFYFGANMGGSVQDNIDRWVNQVSQPDGRPSREVARTAHRNISGMSITTVDVTGDFAGGMPGMPAAAAAGAASNQRLIGAVVEGPEGLVFFKMMGPAGTMDRARPGFTALIASLHPSGTAH